MSEVRLDLLVLRCVDLELAADFYAALGLTLIKEQHGTGPVHYSARLGRTLLELYPSTDRSGPLRLGLRVPDPNAAAAAALGVAGKRLASASLEEALLHDPDGNTVHLCPYSPIGGAAVARPPEDRWTAGSHVLDANRIAAIIAIVDDTPVILEHRFYRGGRSPEWRLFDVAEELRDYLRSSARPGDAIWVWRFDAVCSDSSALDHGKIPDATGLAPESGAY